MTREELRAIRLAAGLTQREFGARLGYASPPSYRKIETGVQPVPPHVAKLARVVQRYGITALED